MMKIERTLELLQAAYALQMNCHHQAKLAGWWKDRKTGADTTFDYHRDVMVNGNEPKRNIAEMLCLIHSEISEAMEGVRKNLQDDKIPSRSMLEVELADTVIRVFDMAGGLGLDLGGAIVEKLQYNANREDHKIENRSAEGGKKF